MTAPSSPFAQASTWDLVAPGYASASVPLFERYASDALSLAKLGASDRIVDVATGPGSLALLASARVARVDALDFSPRMLSQLRDRAATLGVSNVTAHEGDGQKLAFADDTFDAGFSMFGLMFFPDRSAGFAELHRVIKPGGRCVIASWQPMDGVEMLGAVFEALFAELPELPREQPDVPLGDPTSIRTEMSAAGFHVEVHAATHTMTADTLEQFWVDIRRSFAPIVLLENGMGSEAFEPVAAGILRRMTDRYGHGPVSIAMPAWLAEGRVGDHPTPRTVVPG